MSIYIQFIISSLDPLYKFSSLIKSDNFFGLPQLYNWINNKYNIPKEEILSNYENVISVFPLGRRQKILEKMTQFIDSLILELSIIVTKQTEGCFPSPDFLKTVDGLGLCSPNFKNVNFWLISPYVESKDLDGLKSEYINFPKCDDQGENFKIMSKEEYTRKYLIISKVALDLTSIPLSSIVVERSFSKLKHVLTTDRGKLSPDRSRMLSILYFNGKLTV